MSLSRKKLQEHCTSVNVTKEKPVQRRFSTVELGEGNGEKMCLLPAPEGAECLRRSDAGCQTVPDAWSSDEEGPVTNCQISTVFSLQCFER